MASLLLLFLVMVKRLNGPYNSYWFVLCVGLDEIALVQLLRLRAYLKR